MLWEEMLACAVTVLTRWAAATRGAVSTVCKATTSALRRKCRQVSSGLRGVETLILCRGGSRTSSVHGAAAATAAGNNAVSYTHLTLPTILLV